MRKRGKLVGIQNEIRRLKVTSDITTSHARSISYFLGIQRYFFLVATFRNFNELFKCKMFHFLP